MRRPCLRLLTRKKSVILTLAGRWWDARGPFAALQRMTPARVACRATPEGCSGLTASAGSRSSISAAAAVSAEPLARLGAQVTGIDAGAEAITAARNHARISGLEIT